MTRQTVRFEWFIGEEYWHGSHTLDKPFPTDVQSFFAMGERSLALALLRGASLLIAAMVIISSVSPSPQQIAYERAFSTIQTTLQIEERAWKTNDRVLFRRLIDPNMPTIWLSEWRDYWRTDVTERHTFNTELVNVSPDGDLIFADVLVTRPALDWWHTSPYQETRIYRQTATGWVRTVPTAEFWGEPRTQETANLRFEFYAHDAPIVDAIAPQVEATYQELYQVLGVDIPVRTRKLTIRIAPTTRRGWSGYRNRIDMTSPLLARLPQGFSSEEYLARYITNQLVSLTVNRFMNRFSSAYIYRWGIMGWATRGWLEADQLGAPSPWYRQNEHIFLDYSRHRLPLQLDEITRRRAKNEAPDPQRIFWQYIAAYSVIDYAVSEYGRAQLPTLLRGWGKHNSWDELIPVIYGTSLAEFEAGWNQYLADQYGW